MPRPPNVPGGARSHRSSHRGVGGRTRGRPSGPYHNPYAGKVTTHAYHEPPSFATLPSARASVPRHHKIHMTESKVRAVGNSQDFDRPLILQYEGDILTWWRVIHLRLRGTGREVPERFKSLVNEWIELEDDETITGDAAEVSVSTASLKVHPQCQKCVAKAHQIERLQVEMANAAAWYVCFEREIAAREGARTIMVHLDTWLAWIRAQIEKPVGNNLLRYFQLHDLDARDQEFFRCMQQELREHYPPKGDMGLVLRVQATVPTGWANMAGMMMQYLRLIRDSGYLFGPMTADDPSHTFDVRAFVDQSIIALGDATNGVRVLPIVLDASRRLTQIAISFDKASRTAASTKYVEDCANTLRDAFIKCLAGSSGLGSSAQTTRPEGKREGIYLTANACLKLLFQCRKLRNAQQIYVSIDAQSPHLSFYPAAQRVTYLYYLGRYHFANSHFYRAQLALQTAYDSCHREAVNHRRLMLVYLIASNMCLGRFPSSKLLLRGDAAPLSQFFLPLCKIIRSGDLGSFHKYFDLDSPAARWFLRRRILMQLKNRCEVLVWRTLIRKTFILCGVQPSERSMPFLRMTDVQRAARFALTRISTLTSTNNNHTNQDTEYIDPDFADLPTALAETGYDVDTGTYTDPATTNQPTPPVTPLTPNNNEPPPTLFEIESIFQSLLSQGFLRGFLQHANPRFAIPGSKTAGGPVVAGFPCIWEVIRERSDDGVVPGWVREGPMQVKAGGFSAGAGMAAMGGGRVVNLNNARPVGVGP